MNPNSFFTRSIILAFIVLIGFALAKAFYLGSIWGIVLALVSLGAAIYFINVLIKAGREPEEEQTA